MKITSIGLVTLLVAVVMSQPVTKEEQTASKRTTILTEVQGIPDSESEASENKEKRGAARLSSVSSNSLTAERPGLNQQNQLADISQLTQAPQHLYAPHPYSFVLPYPQPKLTYTPSKTPYLLPPQQQQLLQLPAFGQQHQQYMLIIPPQQSPAQHQLLMLIAPPSATGFHYIAQPPAPNTGLPPQHLINFYAGQPTHQAQQPQIQQQREQPLLQHIPQQTQQPIHLQQNQPLPQHQSTRLIYTQEQPHHFSYQTIPQEHQPIFSTQSFVQKLQPTQNQQIHQQNQQQQQYLIEDSTPTPATLVNTYGTRLHSQPSHQNQQQQQQNLQQQQQNLQQQQHLQQQQQHLQQQQQQQQHHLQQQQQQQYKTIIKV